MYSTLLGFLLSCIFLNSPTWALQVPTSLAQPQSTKSREGQLGTAPSPSSQDPQAVSIVNQALSVTGGISAISAIDDYTATGNVTYHMATDVQGTVTVRGSVLNRLRIDANLPTGMRSEVIGPGFTCKEENGVIWYPQFQVPMSPESLVLPHLLLTPALIAPGFTLRYKGIVELDGRQAHEIEVERVLQISNVPDSIRKYNTVDFFIDTSSFQVVMTQDLVLNERVRHVRYADFRLINGISVPFSISEEISGQPSWQIQFHQFSFNSGLQESDFKVE
jgi:hypothetical protein